LKLKRPITDIKIIKFQNHKPSNYPNRDQSLEKTTYINTGKYDGRNKQGNTKAFYWLPKSHLLGCPKKQINFETRQW